MDPKAMEPYGLALRDFLYGDTEATAVIRRDDGLEEDLPMGVFFGEPSSFSPIDQAALDHCRGKVLDVGAGAGRHSLALQERGVTVTAIDVSPHAVDVMLQRGVKDVHCADIFDFTGGLFDTVLMLGHGVGMVGDLAGLDRFLNRVRSLVKPGGQVLVNSVDVRSTDNPRHLEYHEANRRDGRYIGQIRMHLQYRWSTGPVYDWLHVDPDTLSQHAAKARWVCEIVHQEESGDYLARLSPQREPTGAAS